MKDKYKHNTSQLFNFAKDSYLERTSRPIYAMVFLLPFIIFYEVGTFCINTDILNQSQIRVVAFVWLQNLLESLGFGGKFAWVAPPLAVVVILIALQITSAKQWRFWLRDILPMTAECILLAVPLIVLTLFLSSSAGPAGNISWFDDSAIRAQAGSLPSCSSVPGSSLSLVSAEAGELCEDSVPLILFGTHAPSDTAVVVISLLVAAGDDVLPVQIYLMIEPKLLGTALAA